MKCIVVDDEHLARVLLEDYIKKIPDLELISSYSSCFEAIKVMQKQPIDLLFLDIQMPDIRGTNFVKTMTEKPMIVFTTAYPEYAVESYDLQAIDYLLKPIEFERFVQAYHKAIEFTKRRHVNLSESENFLLVKSKHGTHKILYKDILYIEGLKEYVMIHTLNQKQIITLQSLTKLENSLPEAFLRIHKSYIVNSQWVNTLYGNQVIINETKIPIGKSYKEKVLNNIFKSPST